MRIRILLAAAGLTLASAALTNVTLAQTPAMPHQMSGDHMNSGHMTSDQMQGGQMQGGQMQGGQMNANPGAMVHHHDEASAPAAGRVPTMPGQEAFGTVQEIVAILEADPNTDWSKVNLGALREHLIDMDEVTMKAAAQETPIEGGLKIAVTGSGRTLLAIQRMIPAHAATIDGMHGWKVSAAPLPNGELLTVTSADAKEVTHIRGLGFIGILATGAHHQVHHLAMARGERHIQ